MPGDVQLDWISRTVRRISYDTSLATSGRWQDGARTPVPGLRINVYAVSTSLTSPLAQQLPKRATVREAVMCKIKTLIFWPASDLEEVSTHLGGVTVSGSVMPSLFEQYP